MKDRKEYFKQYNQRPEIKLRRKEYDLKNKEKIKVRRRKYEKDYYNKLPQRIAYMKEYAQNPELKERKKEYQKKYSQRPEIKKRYDLYEINNRERFRERKRKYIIKYFKKRRKQDITFRICMNLRIRIRQAINMNLETGKVKSSSKYGINYKAILEYLKPFPNDIENYQVDHIIPLSLFDFNNPEQIQIAFAPENHQWLTKENNLRKGNRLVLSNSYN